MNALLGLAGQLLLKAIEWLQYPNPSNRRSNWAFGLGLLQLLFGAIFVALLTIAVKQIGPFVNEIIAGAAIVLSGTGMVVVYSNMGRCFIKSIEWRE